MYVEFEEFKVTKEILYSKLGMAEYLLPNIYIISEPDQNIQN